MKFQEIVNIIRTLFECSLSIFFIVHKMRGRVTRDGAICAKNSKFDCFDEASPITEKAISYGLLPRFWLLDPTVSGRLVTMSYQ